MLYLRKSKIAHIPNNRTGWVYFLDDDNLMHNNIWMVFQTRAISNIILLGAQHCPDFNRERLHYPALCKNGKVDTGSAIFSAQKVINRPWVTTNVYDGQFIVDTCKMDVNQVTLLQIIASYHNGLLCMEVEFHS